jgi:hypothetical protein
VKPVHIYDYVSLNPSYNFKIPDKFSEKCKIYLIFNPFYNIILHGKVALCVADDVGKNTDKY